MKHLVSTTDVGTFDKADVFDVETAYGEYLETIESDDRSGHFHPSAVGMCPRRTVYGYTQAERDPLATSGKSREIFDLGHAVHDIVQSRFEAMGDFLRKEHGVELTFQREVPHIPETDFLRQEFGIGGTCDGIIELRWPDGTCQRMVLEIKSSAENAFYQMTGPKDDHVRQGHVYAFRFDCPIILIWYYNKNDSQRRVFTVPYQPALADEVILYYASLLDHVREGTLPDRVQSNFSCPECEYAKVCGPEPRFLRKRNLRTPRRKTVGAFTKRRRLPTL